MGSLSQDYFSLKSFKSFGLLSPKRYEIDPSNEVINIAFGQGAAKISEHKVGGQKKYLLTQPDPGALVSKMAKLADIFLSSNFYL